MNARHCPISPSGWLEQRGLQGEAVVLSTSRSAIQGAVSVVALALIATGCTTSEAKGPLEAPPTTVQATTTAATDGPASRSSKAAELYAEGMRSLNAAREVSTSSTPSARTSRDVCSAIEESSEGLGLGEPSLSVEDEGQPYWISGPPRPSCDVKLGKLDQGLGSIRVSLRYYETEQTASSWCPKAPLWARSKESAAIRTWGRALFSFIEAQQRGNRRRGHLRHTTVPARTKSESVRDDVVKDISESLGLR